MMMPRSSAWRAAKLVERDREALGGGQGLGAHEPRSFLARDVLVVAGRRLGGGGEDRLRQAVGLGEPGRQPVAADLARGPVVLPAGAREVAAHHALDRQHGEPPALRRAPVRSEREEVIRADRAGAGEPERGEAGQHTPLVGDLGGQHDVERGDAVRGHEQQAVVAERVQLPHLAASEMHRVRVGHGWGPPRRPALKIGHGGRPIKPPGARAMSRSEAGSPPRAARPPGGHGARPCCVGRGSLHRGTRMRRRRGPARGRRRRGSAG